MRCTGSEICQIWSVHEMAGGSLWTARQPQICCKDRVSALVLLPDWRFKDVWNPTGSPTTPARVPPQAHPVPFFSRKTREAVEPSVALKQIWRCVNLCNKYVNTEELRGGSTFGPPSPGIPRAPSTPFRPWKRRRYQAGVISHEPSSEVKWLQENNTVTLFPNFPGGPVAPWRPLGPLEERKKKYTYKRTKPFTGLTLMDVAWSRGQDGVLTGGPESPPSPLRPGEPGPPC